MITMLCSGVRLINLKLASLVFGVVIIGVNEAHAIVKTTADTPQTINTCRITELLDNYKLDIKRLRSSSIALVGQSSEGGTLYIRRLNNVPIRATALLLGETGQLASDFVVVGKDALFIVTWKEYEESLPKLPVRVRSTQVLKGFFCDGRWIFDAVSDIVPQSRSEEFLSLAKWMIVELQRHGVKWHLSPAKEQGPSLAK